jgi:hypothetical protein
MMSIYFCRPLGGVCGRTCMSVETRNFAGMRTANQRYEGK